MEPSPTDTISPTAAVAAASKLLASRAANTVSRASFHAEFMLMAAPSAWSARSTAATAERTPEIASGSAALASASPVEARTATPRAATTRSASSFAGAR